MTVLTPEQLRRDQAEGAAREILRLTRERDELRQTVRRLERENAKWADALLEVLRYVQSLRDTEKSLRKSRGHDA